MRKKKWKVKKDMNRKNRERELRQETNPLDRSMWDRGKIS
jgi:hypothetical protein